MPFNQANPYGCLDDDTGSLTVDYFSVQAQKPHIHWFNVGRIVSDLIQPKKNKKQSTSVCLHLPANLIFLPQLLGHLAIHDLLHLTQ